LKTDRLKKLAKTIDGLSQQDEKLIERTKAIAELRRRAAVELHLICAHFVRDLNQLLSQTEIKLDPPEYAPESFQEEGSNLIQINARGRLLQIEFQAPPELISTEDFRVPYILAGAVRSFNQDLLDRDIIEEQFVFYCLEKKGNLWRFFDARTYRTAPFNEDYLAALMEQLV